VDPPNREEEDTEDTQNMSQCPELLQREPLFVGAPLFVGGEGSDNLPSPSGEYNIYK